jgi:hypothetical protein
MYDVGQLTTGSEQLPGLMRLLLAAFAQSHVNPAREDTTAFQTLSPWRSSISTDISHPSTRPGRHRTWRELPVAG